MKPKTLTDSYIKACKPKDKPYKVSDSARLYFLVSTSGSKTWKWNYRLDSKDSTFTIGEYPAIGLAQARGLRDEAKAIVELGIHPLQHKKIEQVKLKNEVATTFYGVAKEWIEHKRASWSPTYAAQVERTVNRYIRDGKYAHLPIKQVTAKEIFALVTAVAVRKNPQGAERKNSAPHLAILLRQWCSGIFRHAIVSGRADSNPVAALNASDMINKPNVKHNRNLNEEELKQLISVMSGFRGQRSTAIAVELLMLTFLRTSELIKAKWTEFDLNKAEWIVPASRMKIKDNGDHFVPLSSQAVFLLKELKEISGKSKQGANSWLFRNLCNSETYMSPRTINRVLERNGFNGPNSTIGFTAHGFRGTASTILHESGFRTEVIEKQLAHKERNAVKAAYNKAQYMEERVEMMKWWSDYIYSIKTQ